MQKERQAYTVGITKEAWMKAKETKELMRTAAGIEPSMNWIVSIAVSKYCDEATKIFTKLELEE